MSLNFTYIIHSYDYPFFFSDSDILLVLFLKILQYGFIFMWNENFTLILIFHNSFQACSKDYFKVFLAKIFLNG